MEKILDNEKIVIKHKEVILDTKNEHLIKRYNYKK